MSEHTHQLVSATPTLGVVDKPNQLYLRMQTAITECHAVDDCLPIAEQASAIAAYFKQIKDEELLWKFLTIKLRAWRRIGELLLTVDATDCPTGVAHISKIRKLFSDDPSVEGMSDSAIYHALKLGRLPADFFESEVGYQTSVSGMINAYQYFVREQWEASPEGQEELKRQQERAQELAAVHAKQDAKLRAQRAERERHEWEAKEQERRDAAAMKAAREEVGYTMDRRDRKAMKEVMFLIKAPIHEQLRQAAFDHRITMQAILRAGLAMWLVAHGYPVNLDDMGLKSEARAAHVALPVKSIPKPRALRGRPAAKRAPKRRAQPRNG
jgi:hypothetical protein